MTEQALDDAALLQRVTSWLQAEGGVRPEDGYALVCAVERLTAERDAARDLAFRATFSPEEGGWVQTEYGILNLPSSGHLWPPGGRVVFYALSPDGDHVCTRSRRVGPWRYSVDPATLPGDVRYDEIGT